MAEAHESGVGIPHRRLSWRIPDHQRQEQGGWWKPEGGSKVELSPFSQRQFEDVSHGTEDAARASSE